VSVSRVFVFPGQGAQKTGMGKDVAGAYPNLAGAVFRAADDILGFSISDLCFHGPDERLAQTEITQPALFTTCVALLSVLSDRGVAPAATAGHSVGEYAALVAARSVTFEEALPVVRLRGELMAAAVMETPGSMAAIMGLDADVVNRICREASTKGTVEPSNINGPLQIVVSGETEAVLEAIDIAKREGGRAIRLKVSAPFHCSMMEPVRAALEPAIRNLTVVDPEVPVIANATGGYVGTQAEIRSALLDQVAAPVRWTDTVSLLLSEGHRSFLEIGPGKVLTGLIRAIDPDASIMSVATPDDVEQVVTQ
jgi:[acyl-carrier-protein] S-malonyltransferase